MVYTRTWKLSLDMVSRGVSTANCSLCMPFRSSPRALVSPAASASASFSSSRILATRSIITGVLWLYIRPPESYYRKLKRLSNLINTEQRYQPLMFLTLNDFCVGESEQRSRSAFEGINFSPESRCNHRPREVRDHKFDVQMPRLSLKW